MSSEKDQLIEAVNRRDHSSLAGHYLAAAVQDKVDDGKKAVIDAATALVKEAFLLADELDVKKSMLAQLTYHMTPNYEALASTVCENKPVILALFWDEERYGPYDHSGNKDRMDNKVASDFILWDVKKAVDYRVPHNVDADTDAIQYGYFNRLTGSITWLDGRGPASIENDV